MPAPLPLVAGDIPDATRWNAAFDQERIAREAAITALSIPRNDVVFNLSASGAVGDGSTNDTPVLQSWLNSLSSGSRVVVPPNTFYYLGATLTMPMNVLIEGAGHPTVAPVFSNFAGPGGFILPATGVTIILRAGSALRSLLVKRAGLLTSPTEAQCLAAVTQWGTESGIAITIEGDTYPYGASGGANISNVMVIGFNKAIYAACGQFSISHVQIDCYNGVEVTHAADQCYLDDVRCEPYYSFANNGSLGSWARPGTAFYLHTGNTGNMLSRCFSFMYARAVTLTDTGGMTVSNCGFEWQPTLGNGITNTSGILLTGANSATWIANIYLAGYNIGCDIQSTGATSIIGGEIVADVSTIKITGGAGCSGIVDGTILYATTQTATPGSGPYIQVGANIGGDNERWKFCDLELTGQTSYARWITIDSTSLAGVDTFNIRGPFLANGVAGAQNMRQSIMHEKLHIQTVPQTTIDGTPTASLALEATGVPPTDPSEVADFLQAGALIGRIRVQTAYTQPGGLVGLVAEPTNGGVVLAPKGNGPLVAAFPDGTAAGGNVRGIYSTDWQRLRATAAQVASGTLSIILGGRDNTASGELSIGGGSGTTASALLSMAYGYLHAVSGVSSAAWGGSGAADHGREGVTLWAGDITASNGTRQEARTCWGYHTTNATPVRLTARAGDAASALNVFNIPDTFAYCLNIDVIGKVDGGSIVLVSQTLRSILSRGTGAGTTVYTAGTTVTNNVGSIGTMAVAISADTTNGGLNITVTGIAGTGISWTAHILSIEAG